MSKHRASKTVGQRLDAAIAELHTRWWNFRFVLGSRIGAFTRVSRASWRSQGWR